MIRRSASASRLLIPLAVVSLASRAIAFEVFDDRLAAHGYAETQVRLIGDDFGSEWDLAQWYWIFDLELELDLIRDGWGPIDLLQGYVRLEARFDCIYSRGCGLFRSVDTYGDRAKSLPDRLNGALEHEAAGVIVLEPTHRRSGDSTDPVTLDRVAAFDNLAEATDGADGIRGVPPPPLRFDDPFPQVFASFAAYRYAQINERGGVYNGLPTRRFGAWRPRNEIQRFATLADWQNPLDNSVQSPVLNANVFNSVFLETGDLAQANSAAAAARGAGANPFRPIPVFDAGGRGVGDTRARGVYYPSTPLRGLIASGDLDSFPFNFSESQRAWNRGASQQQTKELKEVYLDVELFDSRLWMRVGRQTIVWGKTELFRTTDQWNPQDLALASLPSLEESRVPIWALRGIYSFYEIGPLSDVRLELAAGLDDFEPDDLGACGEPYTVNQVCDLTFGAFAHGVSGVGVTGVDRPPSPWDDLSGWEIGARVEFRWGYMSVALSDFWGYDDRPHLERVTTYERNVDPASGRPRFYASQLPCQVGAPGTTLPDEPGCLAPGPTDRRPQVLDSNGNLVANPDLDTNLAGTPRNALDFHHANQQIFNMICSSTIGFNALDRSACGQTIFSSQTLAAGIVPISVVVGALLAGNATTNSLLTAAPPGDPFLPFALPIVALDPGPRDAESYGCLDPHTGQPCGAAASLDLTLTPEQEALLGCGPFWGTSCDDSGIDLMNADASALLQSFAGTEGTGQGYRTDTGPQPGTLPFVRAALGGPACTSADFGGPADAVLGVLPGCRSVDNPLYDPLVDGSPANLGVDTNAAFGMIQFPSFVRTGAGAGQPLTGDPFASELSGLSWNFQMIVVAFSPDFQQGLDAAVQAAIDAGQDPDQAALAYAYSGPELGGQHCSFITPQNCSGVRSLYDVAGVQRNDLRAGGNGRFGRRTFQWHSGGDAVLRYRKRNVLGLALDFAEDYTKSSWGVEFAWIEGNLFADHDQRDGLSRSDEFDLTISVDRPTFVNFLNPNRTLFINSQWFFQYLSNYGRSFTASGPWNVLATLTVQSGYAQDRLLPSLTLVYDFKSSSGAALPSVQYRFTSNFSAAVGASFFMGRTELVDMPLNPLDPAGSAGNRSGPLAYKDGVERGVSPIRMRDELFVRIRYTF